jgi:hypothetical protein
VFDIFLLLAITIGAGVLFFQSLRSNETVDSFSKNQAKKINEMAFLAYGVEGVLFKMLPVDFDLKSLLMDAENAFRDTLSSAWKENCMRMFITEAFEKSSSKIPQKALVYHRRLITYSSNTEVSNMTLKFLYTDEGGSEPFKYRFKAIGDFQKKKNGEEKIELIKIHSVDIIA